MEGQVHCRICGRLLTNPTSVEREIGPVCWGRLQRGEIEQTEVLTFEVVPKFGHKNYNPDERYDPMPPHPNEFEMETEGW